MERFCKDLKEHETNIINYEKKMNKISLIKRKKYAKKNLILIKMIKMHLNYATKKKIIVIIKENIEELHIKFII